MSGNKHFGQDVKSHTFMRSGPHDLDGVKSAQRVAYAIVIGFVVVAFIHAIW